MKTILITGGSGFIGKHLVAHFRAKPNDYKVLAPTRQELDLTRKDDVDEYLRDNPIDIVIHGANARKWVMDKIDQDGVGQNKNDFEQNMRMFLNLQHTNMVFLGSWDDRKDTPHGDYKRMATGFTALYPNRIAILRLFGVIGEGDTTSRFIPTIMKQSKAGEPITINGDHLMEYSDVKDVCKAVEELVTGAIPCGVYDLISDNAELLSVTGKYVAELGGSRSKVTIMQRCPEKDWYPTPASESIHLKTKTLLQDSLRRVYNSL